MIFLALLVTKAEDGSTEASGGLSPLPLKYLNRLSDLFFILARVVGQEAGDVLWVPGADRTPSDPKGVRQRRRLVRKPDAADAPAPVEPPPAS